MPVLAHLGQNCSVQESVGKLATGTVTAGMVEGVSDDDNNGVKIESYF